MREVNGKMQEEVMVELKPCISGSKNGGRIMTTPNARVILPREATEDMMLAGMASDDLMANATQGDAVLASYRAMLAASPNAGKVTEAELEKAFTKFHDAQHIDGLSEAEAFRAALSAIGLEVE